MGGSARSYRMRALHLAEEVGGERGGQLREQLQGSRSGSPSHNGEPSLTGACGQSRYAEMVETSRQYSHRFILHQSSSYTSRAGTPSGTGKRGSGYPPNWPDELATKARASAPPFRAGVKARAGGPLGPSVP
jgi:hypothetical protein